MDDQVNYKRVMALGVWLEKYLVSMSPWNIEELADDAIKLLNVDYERCDDDPVIRVIKILMDKYEIPETHMIDEPIFKSAIANIRGLSGYGSAEELTNKEVAILSDMQRGIAIRGIIPLFIQDMSFRGSRAPWEYAMATQQKLIYDEPDTPHLFLEEYNNIREVLAVKGDKVEIVNKMMFPDSDDGCTWIRFPALICRIFITFLREGGRDYCTLCKHCGKFILAERKGRRQFCGGKCRIAHKREKDKEEL